MKFLACAFLLLASAPLCAETYKWVDEKGVTNYSNAPPPPRTSRASVVKERISVVPADPSLAAASVALRMSEARRAQTAQADWLLRQQLALAYASSPGFGCPYEMDCGYYGGPFYRSYPTLFVTRTARHAGPAFPRHHRPFSVSR